MCSLSGNLVNFEWFRSKRYHRKLIWMKCCYHFRSNFISRLFLVIVSAWFVSITIIDVLLWINKNLFCHQTGHNLISLYPQTLTHALHTNTLVLYIKCINGIDLLLKWRWKYLFIIYWRPFVRSVMQEAICNVCMNTAILYLYICPSFSPISQQRVCVCAYWSFSFTINGIHR